MLQALNTYKPLVCLHDADMSIQRFPRGAEEPSGDKEEMTWSFVVTVEPFLNLEQQFVWKVVKMRHVILVDRVCSHEGSVRM